MISPINNNNHGLTDMMTNIYKAGTVQTETINQNPVEKVAAVNKTAENTTQAAGNNPQWKWDKNVGNSVDIMA